MAILNFLLDRPMELSCHKISCKECPMLPPLQLETEANTMFKDTLVFRDIHYCNTSLRKHVRILPISWGRVIPLKLILDWSKTALRELKHRCTIQITLAIYMYLSCTHTCKHIMLAGTKLYNSHKKGYHLSVVSTRGLVGVVTDILPARTWSLPIVSST